MFFWKKKNKSGKRLIQANQQIYGTIIRKQNKRQKLYPIILSIAYDTL